MRRFLIWSGLAVVIGLALAGGGYWAYDHVYARFQPVTITRGKGEIQRLLDEASWVSGGEGGAPLYVIGYRDSPALQTYERQEADKLRAAGVEVRVLMFARPDLEGQARSTAAERATIAELWLTRDWSLYQRWTATPSREWTAVGIPAADGNLARGAVVEAGRQFADRLGRLLRDAGVRPDYPLIIWRDREGFMKACACADARSWVFIRDDLGAPDAIGTAPATAPEAPMTPAQAPAQTLQGLPYPDLSPLPPATGVQTPSSPTAPGTSARPGPTAPPKAAQSDDTTFF